MGGFFFSIGCRRWCWMGGGGSNRWKGNTRTVPPPTPLTHTHTHTHTLGSGVPMKLSYRENYWSLNIFFSFSFAVYQLFFSSFGVMSVDLASVVLLLFFSPLLFCYGYCFLCVDIMFSSLQLTVYNVHKAQSNPWPQKSHELSFSSL